MGLAYCPGDSARGDKTLVRRSFQIKSYNEVCLVMFLGQAEYTFLIISLIDWLIRDKNLSQHSLRHVKF